MSSHPASTLTGHQIFQGLCWPHDQCVGAIVPVMPPAEVQLKTAALQQILHNLSAADSGWPADQPQTSATLLPYVADEVEELLEALQANPIAALSETDQAVAEDKYASSPRLLADLSADWLWAIAASSLLGMQLLEGVAARIHGLPQVYGVRLVPTLEIQFSDDTYALDLTTQSWGSLVPAFASDTFIQLLDSPTASRLTAAALQTQICHRSTALVPALHPWFEGLLVNLCLPDTVWTTGQARLVPQLLPLTTQVADPESVTMAGPLSSFDHNGLPTARVWQAEQSSTIVVDTPTVVVASPRQPSPWPLESELTFQHAEALIPALRTLHQQSLSRQVAEYGRSHAEIKPPDLLEAVLSSSSPVADGLGLTFGQSPLSLSELCHQVKWLWIQAGQEYMPLMSGVPARQLRSGQRWQAGTLLSQGQLLFMAEDQAIAALDVASSEWMAPATNLDVADLLHLSLATEPGAPVWRVDQLTQQVSQTVAARSPLIASLNTPQPVKLWSPQAELFPEMVIPDLYLRWQLVLTFFPR
ncbi:MAG: hypothetical protein F6K00_20415 [Leptolyngbya sp. SIOISBB]|nr:hypothetical protein [Leptolyngbya sp. SIOISBB]